MKHYELNKSIELTVADIDEQHEQLEDALEVLNQLISHGSEEDIEQGLRDFTEFAASFFLFHTFTEERLMYESHYPSKEYREHAEEHKEMINEIITYREQDDSSSPRIRGMSSIESAKKMSSTFKEWVNVHTNTSDKKLIDWLKKHGY